MRLAGGGYASTSERPSFAEAYGWEASAGHEDTADSPSWRSARVTRFLADVTRTEELTPMTMALKEGKVRFPPNSWLEDCLFYICNNHVLLSICFAHPAHPLSRKRRLLVLGNSLAFAFFTTCVVRGLFGFHDLAQTAASVLGAILQLVWDLPGAMLGSCVCVNMPALPIWLRRCCGCASLVCLSCHLLFGLVYASIGALLLLALPWVGPEHVAVVSLKCLLAHFCSFSSF